MKNLAIPGILIIIVLFYAGYLSLGKQLSYYSAHVACGNYYLSQRPLSSILDKEAKTKPFNIDWLDNLFLKLIDYSVEDEKKILSSSFGSVKTTMKYYLYYGCSQDLNKEFAPRERLKTENFPELININIQRLIEDEFIEDHGHRAIVIAHQDVVVGKLFDEYSTMHTPLLSWSMTKSLTSLLFGRLVNENLIELDTKVFPDSSEPMRKSLTFRHLLNHVDGLNYQEAYYPFTDFFKMFVSSNIGNHLSSLDFKYTPGEHWAYSSAATNLLTYKLSEIGNKFGFNIQEMFQYFLFDELKIRDAVISKDPNGNMIASSLGFLSPTAWLNIGKLIKNKGVFNGKQLIDNEFIEFLITPASLNNGQKISNYGGQWWLNTNDPLISPALHSVPFKIISANGFQGQRLLIIPELDLMIVRLGLTNGRDEWINEGKFISDLIKIYGN